MAISKPLPSRLFRKVPPHSKRVKKDKIITIHKKSSDLNNTEVKEMFALYSPHHNIDYNSFYDRTVNTFSEFGIFKTKNRSEIIGFMGLRITEYKIEHKNYIMLYYGQMFIQHQYRGYGLPPKYTLSSSVRQKLKHPSTSIYLWGDTISYKSFISVQNNVKECYPKPGLEIPDYILNLRDLLGEKYYPDDYIVGTGIVQKKSKKIFDKSIEISDEDLKNPYIKLYAELNPGYRNGHGLILIIPLNPTNIFSTFFHLVGKLFRIKGKNRVAK